jgi:ketosteroid isomerase-like protein
MAALVDHSSLWPLVEAYRDAWVGHDLDGLMGLVTEDIVFENFTAGERVEGSDAFREHVRGGEDFAAVQWTATATRSDGQRVEWDGVDVIEVRDGQVCANHVYSSSHAPRLLA